MRPDDNLRPLDMAELRARQLRILDAVVDHCGRHGLTVYLCAGSLLGAVRHKGFIPWDDDIDIMLPRADYERLCTTFGQTGATESMSVHSLSTDPSHQLPFAKICDDTTVLHVESDVVRDIGVYVDVFPIDGWSQSGPRRWLQRVGLISLQQLFSVKHLAMRPSRGRVKEAVLATGKALLTAVSARSIAVAMTWLARRSELALSDAGGVIVWGYREVIPRSSYGAPQTVEFEGRHVPAPSNTHDVLQRIYGDYLKLPPESQRVTHHRFTAYARS